MISPRERGRYSGYLGATFAVATVGGPLLGGVITDTSWLGWRWCFYVGVPFAVIALIVLQKTLHLPVVKRDVKVDWAGAFFITAAVSLLLVWVTFAGDKYDWVSWQTYAMVGGSIVLGAAVRARRVQGERADHPAAAVPQPHHHPRLARLAVRRCRDVHRHGLLQPVLPAGPRQVPDDVRCHDDPDDRRSVRLLDGLRPVHHPDRPLEGLAGQRRCAGDRGPGPARHHPLRHRRTGTWPSSWPCWVSASA